MKILGKKTGGGRCFKGLYTLLMFLGSAVIIKGSDTVPVETWQDGLIKFDDNLQIEDKLTNVTVSGNEIKYDYIPSSFFGVHEASKSPRYGIRRTDEQCFNGTETITVSYESIGNYAGRSIGIKMVMKPNKSNHSGWIDLSKSSVIFLGFNNLEDHQQYLKASFVHGLTYFNTYGMSIDYQLFYTDTRKPLQLSECYWTWGSLNPQEAISSNNPNTKYFRVNEAYPEVRTVNDSNYTTTDNPTYAWESVWAYDFGYQHTNYTWAIGKTGYFEDQSGSSDFYKSAVSMLVTSNDGWFRFRVMGRGSIWFTPMLAPAGATAPDPTSYIAEPTKNVTSAEHMVGEKVRMVSSQKTMRMSAGATGMKKYVNMSLYLTVPKEITYNTAYVQEMYGQRVPGTVRWNESTREVSFEISNSYCQNNMIYDGREYQLVVDGTVNETFKNTTSATVKARTAVNSTFRNANNSYVTPKYFTINTSVTNGNITNSSSIRSNMNSSVSYSPTNTTDYVLDSVTVDGASVSISSYQSSYTFSNITSNHSIAVNYRRVYKVETSKVGNGIITDSVYKIEKDQSRVISYTPNEGYYVKSVTVDGTKISLLGNTKSVTLSGISEDHKVNVVFAKKPTIDVTTNLRGDVVWSKVHPTALYKVSGTDYLGRSQEFYRLVKFDDYSSISKNLKVMLPAGKYVISTLNINEIGLYSIEKGSSSSISGNTLVVDTRDSDNASGEFTILENDFSEYTSNSEVVNPLK